MSLKDEIIEGIKASMAEKIERAEAEANVNTMKRFAQQAPDVVRSAMDQFYLAYSPDIYVRTYGLHEGVISSTSVIANGNTATINVSSKNVPDHKNDSGEYIYEGAFRRGIHGRSDIFISTPPKMMIQDDLQDLMDNIQQEELTKAAKKYLGR